MNNSVPLTVKLLNFLTLHKLAYFLRFPLCYEDKNGKQGCTEIGLGKKFSMCN